MKTALITALGSAAAMPAVCSLQKQGMRVVGCDLYPRAWNEASMQADAFFTAVTTEDPQAYLQLMSDAVQTYGVDYLIPLTDPEVDLLCQYADAWREQYGCIICTPSEETVQLARNKLHMAEYLSEAKLCDVIPTHMASGFEPDAYPVFMKPVGGRSSQAQLIAYDADTYHAAAARRADYIVQPYLPGTVYTVDVARDSKGHVQVLCRHELLRTVNGLGTTVELLPGHPLEQTCARIADAVQLTGVVNIEFIEHDGTFYFLEMNPRMSGGVGFSVQAGVDFPSLLPACCNYAAIGPRPSVRSCVMTRAIRPVITEEPSHA